MTKAPGQLPKNLPFPELPGFLTPEERQAYRNEIKERLIQRIRDGFYQPGDRFFSNRAIADTVRRLIELRGVDAADALPGEAFNQAR